MSYTKRQFITAALDEIGIASYEFELTAEQLQAAVRRLDSMMADWNARGIRVSYPLMSSPELTDIDSETDVPDRCNEAIITNLAVRLAPSYGKTVSADTKASAKRGYNLLLTVLPPEQALPTTMPAGAGNKPWRLDNPFILGQVPQLQAGEDGNIEFN